MAQVIPTPYWETNIPIDQVIAWRRHIHQNPELSFKEVKTSEYVAGVLKSFGNIEVIRPTATSVIGILHGAKPGKTIAFRADMDALPVQEETGLPFSSSVSGVSHACGHDAHTAILLGTVATLSKLQKDLMGTVYFIFQHAEEQDPGGAQEIVKSGVLNKVEAFFGLHVFSNYPVGHVGILPTGAASTTADFFYLTIQGKGTHGSMPHLGIDPIVTGAEIVTALQTIISRNVTPGEMAVISVGQFQAGDAPNVIPDRVEISGTVRTIAESTRQLIADRIKIVVDNISKANGATCNLNYVFSYKPIQNDIALNKFARESVAKVLGNDCVFDAPRMTASEDFAYYSDIAPECFLILGVGSGGANHNPAFNIDESALVNGVKTEVQIILDYLSKK
ncbi:N-acyl-L-amino acid amidohydrolase [Tenuifilaceae bacterium CYCD]|nr:N-acyl-L-amino acid amidohydrolase [Tenuifilaceae bacterium CYCD]